mmetsp:Transcript_15203/g.22419  ORF Transcript_15203/g.22419 Transcript_15203/m.22419 type:complete len:155 (-) Transcript_15203:993-1457(-)
MLCLLFRFTIDDLVILLSNCMILDFLLGASVRYLHKKSIKAPHCRSPVINTTIVHPNLPNERSIGAFLDPHHGRWKQSTKSDAVKGTRCGNFYCSQIVARSISRQQQSNSGYMHLLQQVSRSSKFLFYPILINGTAVDYKVRRSDGASFEFHSS